MADKHKGSDTKYVLRSDGKTDTFFGGSGKADGPGYGHVVSDSSGNVSYARESASNGGGVSVYKQSATRWCPVGG